MNFNGGTLRTGADNNTWVPNGLNIYFKAGGATIDTNGHNVTIDSGLSQDPAIPTTNTNGLTKLGSGTLTLTNSSGFNAFRGPVNLNGGVISVALDGELGYPTNQNYVLAETHVFSASVVNEARLSYVRESVPTQTGREGY